MKNLRLDLGCGSKKKEGMIGLDIQAGPGVDYVLDLQREPLPFPDGSVEYVFSSHLLEHIKDPTSLFAEVSRVCQDGARLEFWTPYVWENSAFIIDHKMFYNEDHYLHICVWFVDFWKEILKKRWLLHEIVYIVEPRVLMELFRQRISLDFALKYYKGVVKEFGVMIEVRDHFRGPEVPPRRSFAVERMGDRHPLPPVPCSAPAISSEELAQAMGWFSAPFVAPSSAPPPSWTEPASPAPRRLDSVRRLLGRARTVAQEEGLQVLIRKVGRHLKRKRERWTRQN